MPQEIGLLVAEVQVEAVLNGSCRVVPRHVERREVVPLGLDLGTLGNLIAHAEEDPLELLPDLGDEVRVAGALAREDFGEIEALGDEPLAALGGRELGFALGDEWLEATAHLVERLPRRWALLGEQPSEQAAPANEQRVTTEELRGDAVELG